MTLEKHRLDGIPQITRKTLPAPEFEALLKGAGYSYLGSAPAQGGRRKTWWTHGTHRRVEVIYSPDMQTVITAYHPEP
ncbi:MAG: hypothetical protein IGQ88_03755 [Gloeomargaritaceae cyanobacterium C42_A2020_066]|nr:hypothetical protein [Gloeomargaritaceae cyanobacterium C42_A2020_066]